MPVNISGTVGNPPITDASATSGDVASGKVFYNNDGRQLGSGNITTKETIILEAGKYTEKLMEYTSDITCLDYAYNHFMYPLESNTFIVNQIQIKSSVKLIECMYYDKIVILYRENMGLPSYTSGFGLVLYNGIDIVFDKDSKMLYETVNKYYTVSGIVKLTIDCYY